MNQMIHLLILSICQFYYIHMKVYRSRNIIIKGESDTVGNLWLGDFESARNKKDLKRDHIGAVVTAGLGMKISYPSEIKHKLLPLYDSQVENIERFFDSSFDFIDDALKSGNVLIHCYAGISRSTTILAAYLMRKNKWGYRETLSMIKKQRFVIGPNKGFLNQLRKFEASLGSGSMKVQESTDTSAKEIEDKPKQKKSFVEGFLSYKRDLSIASKPRPVNERSKTAAKIQSRA